MVKQQLEDTFEKLVEQGATQAKKAGKSAVQQISSTISPTKMWEQILGVSSQTPDSNDESSKHKKSMISQQEGRNPEVKRENRHTPLNLDKLAKSYQNNDKQKAEILKQRLFQLVKRGEEEVLQQNKQAESEKKRKEIHELQEKKRKEEAKKKQDQTTEIPKGRIRRSIFSPKKVAQRQHAEVKPSSGKQ
ncbi:hypothetical protein A2954_03050 [Candidatus Roizmanbacteria bacterium RIFCSPLOWO2_01_FULL_37_12]|uniref:Uncharacterized protein n=1 Tax=Candidatus Roizmanbacteria bacterium RIFCSPLOWO2_01_FULL_37_12 TaxID=1802056 RepID=A0A1F7IAG3_9BACT|nr:MAG: hypothetical protein A3D76_04290 [Candidatus Roizmanbacteria bacterium RIFCSPHIGHO2_02_FULL_37_9b]OGK40353.1 MAG: hypothetical protein A2954_03050 [Candidatus Roizmanbacteria bacterium RIFCSPLOWO2_01_FULL_37_12]